MGDNVRRAGLTTPPEALNNEQQELWNLLQRIHALGPVRGQSLFQLNQFVDSAEMGFGGTLMLQAPHRSSKRTVSEFNYIGERAGYTPLPR
jgi:hypothetical protein